MKNFWNIKELIFVVYKRDDGGFTALEANVGLAVMADDEASLTTAARLRVAEFFEGKFSSTVRLRSFRDTVFTIQPNNT
ncbi:hypothetical protein ACFOET_09395 [Parapedobacter deserti]|uniref:DUF1902 domain-containing protein n=1 Tax=Parapedobacter deserti TaxID=1912957 RepID=A0ABV7JIF3_9SPHI